MMINTQLERIVTLVMDAYVDVHGDEYDITPMFELELRKALMQTYCSEQPQKVNTAYTYTITPGQGGAGGVSHLSQGVMGTWDTSTKQILNG